MPTNGTNRICLAKSLFWSASIGTAATAKRLAPQSLDADKKCLDGLDDLGTGVPVNKLDHRDPSFVTAHRSAKTRVADFDKRQIGARACMPSGNDNGRRRLAPRTFHPQRLQAPDADPGKQRGQNLNRGIAISHFKQAARGARFGVAVPALPASFCAKRKSPLQTLVGFLHRVLEFRIGISAYPAAYNARYRLTPKCCCKWKACSHRSTAGIGSPIPPTTHQQSTHGTAIDNFDSNFDA
ncbi:hypothetical protein DO70_2131 [Burkholderia pseudomallei]|nr:hypothetical protein DO70_2131 [Burkholderia pseudomallei]